MPNLREAAAQTLPDEILMVRKHPIANRFGWLLVESDADRKLYQHFFPSAFWHIRPADGWENVVQTIDTLQIHEQQGIIGIIDADFRRLKDNETKLPDHVFLTDGHDAEIMLLHSPAFGKVLQEYSHPEIDTDKQPTTRLAKFEAKKGQPILKILLEAAKPLGVLRLVNDKNKIGLQFKRQKDNGFEYLDKAKFIETKSLAYNWESILKALENFNSKINHFKVKGADAKAEAEAHLNTDIDLAELCNGHDVIQILALALERAISNLGDRRRKELPIELEKALRHAYYPEHFAQTQLYRDLKAWPVPPGFHLEILP